MVIYCRATCHQRLLSIIDTDDTTIPITFTALPHYPIIFLVPFYCQLLTCSFITHYYHCIWVSRSIPVRTSSHFIWWVWIEFWWWWQLWWSWCQGHVSYQSCTNTANSDCEPNMSTRTTMNWHVKLWCMVVYIIVSRMWRRAYGSLHWQRVSFTNHHVYVMCVITYSHCRLCYFCGCLLCLCD